MHRRVSSIFGFAAALSAGCLLARSEENVMLSGVPDYSWHAGCFGTASGNMMGYWDRHGFPEFYTGPTAGGIAPLDSNGANVGIRSLWASRAGFDGRSPGQLGHIDDYWVSYADDSNYSYESTAEDPYVTAGRPEHEADCTGDFIGASQRKWVNLNDECDGNIDAYSFTFWDASGARRTNYIPRSATGDWIRDIPSGLRAWTQWKKFDCETSSQLADFNPTVPAGAGFTFKDLKAEIDAGYPVMIFMQPYSELYRDLPGMSRANPSVHGMLAYGYFVGDDGAQYVRYKTSWGGSGENRMSAWDANDWEAQLPVRGFITYHPFPKITSIQAGKGGSILVKWDGPDSELVDMNSGESRQLNRYVLERSASLTTPHFAAVTSPAVEHHATIESSSAGTAFFRVRLLDGRTGE